MAEAVAWIPEYSVGVAELDLQHQRLFRISRELHDAIRMGDGHERLGGILARIVMYTIDHFATEEELMLRYGFPGVFAHRFEHNKFTIKISALQREYLAGKADAAEALLQDLEQWLHEHVTKRDREYVNFLHSKGVK
jgi:hemerythrin-like metal-binding protein